MKKIIDCLIIITLMLISLACKITLNFGQSIYPTPTLIPTNTPRPTLAPLPEIGHLILESGDLPPWDTTFPPETPNAKELLNFKADKGYIQKIQFTGQIGGEILILLYRSVENLNQTYLTFVNLMPGSKIQVNVGAESYVSVIESSSMEFRRDIQVVFKRCNVLIRISYIQGGLDDDENYVLTYAKALDQRIIPYICK